MQGCNRVFHIPNTPLQPCKTLFQFRKAPLQPCKTLFQFRNTLLHSCTTLYQIRKAFLQPSQPCFNSETHFRTLQHLVSISKRTFAPLQWPFSKPIGTFARCDRRCQKRSGLAQGSNELIHTENVCECSCLFFGSIWYCVEFCFSCCLYCCIYESGIACS